MGYSNSPYRFRLWTPYNVDYSAATYSIEMKAPEIGNSEEKARNQTFARNRAGTTFVYDRGRNYNEMKALQFRAISDFDRAKLLVFLEAIQWGATKCMMQQYDGTQRVVRVASTKIKYTDTGFITRNRLEGQVILWDFDLDILDLTDNDDANAESIPPMSQLGLHLADFNEPHNPKTIVTVNISDGAKVIESFSTKTWNTVIWSIEVEKADGTSKGFACIVGQHNGTPVADATGTPAKSESRETDAAGFMATNITFAVDLNGTGVNQVMRLKVTSAIDGAKVSVRRSKF